MTSYTCDFETVNDINDCRVWAYSMCDIESEEIEYGNTIEGFFNILKNRNLRLYFHNLKFDGEFILYYLFRNGYKYNEKCYEKSFKTVIADTGQWYMMKIHNGYDEKGKPCYLTIIDSLKIIPFSVEKIGKDFNLGVEKLEIDYNKERPLGYQLTLDEIAYIKNDVLIVAKALKILFNMKLNKTTQGSNALYDYKQSIGGEKNFRKWFPLLSYENDKIIRKAYRGGFTYLNPKYKDKIVNGGKVYDVNSLYPYIMYTRLLPYGEPLEFSGKYKNNKNYPIYIQIIRCQFKIKENKIPTIQLKHTGIFNDTEYLTSSGNEDVILYLTNVDYELFIEHYNIYNIEYLGGFCFKARKGMFKKYIDKWIKVKIESKQAGNKSLYTLAKLMLNALYGKFGLNPDVKSKIPFFDGELVHYKISDSEVREGIYIPMAIFITSYAREKTIRSAQTLYKRFIYADTDSLHIECDINFTPDLDIDSVKLGYWDNELIFEKAKYNRQKRYIEYGYEPKNPNRKFLKVTCAGMPSTCHSYVNFDNFKNGTEIPGKLQNKRVKGGVVLISIPFTIK